MPRITVRFFARYAELTGLETASLPLPNGSATVAEVLDLVRKSIPGARELPARPLAAINLRQAKLDARVQDGDEVALLPPLSGG